MVSDPVNARGIVSVVWIVSQGDLSPRMNVFTARLQMVVVGVVDIIINRKDPSIKEQHIFAV